MQVGQSWEETKVLTEVGMSETEKAAICPVDYGLNDLSHGP